MCVLPWWAVMQAGLIVVVYDLVCRHHLGANSIMCSCVRVLHRSNVVLTTPPLWVSPTGAAHTIQATSSQDEMFVFVANSHTLSMRPASGQACVCVCAWSHL